MPIPPPGRVASGHDIVVIGGSAGGLSALSDLLRHLPADLPAACFAVLHTGMGSPMLLPEILGRVTPLLCTYADEDETIEYGHVYLARPDYHLYLNDSRLQLVHGPKENHQRPSIDPLFVSAAQLYGPRVVGVILSGMLNDGTVGLGEIKRHGGIALVQNPAEATYPDMPRSAFNYVEVDAALPIAGIAAAIEQYARTPPGEMQPPHVEVSLSSKKMDESGDAQGIKAVGRPTRLSCPACGGPIFDVSNGDILHYQCRVGHSFTAEVLEGEQTEVVEAALWTALRTLGDQIILRRKMLERARKRQMGMLTERLEREIAEDERHLAVVRSVLAHKEMLPRGGNGGTEHPQHVPMPDTREN